MAREMFFRTAPLACLEVVHLFLFWAGGFAVIILHSSIVATMLMGLNHILLIHTLACAYNRVDNFLDSLGHLMVSVMLAIPSVLPVTTRTIIHVLGSG